MGGTGRHGALGHDEAERVLRGPASSYETIPPAPPSPLPVPPSTPPSRSSRGESALERLDRIAVHTREDHRKLRRFIGSPPGALGEPGTGFVGLVFGRFDNLDAKVDKSAEALEGVRAELEADRKAAEKRAEAAAAQRAPWSRAAWIVLGAALVVLTGGSISALHGIIAAHWH